MEPFIIPELPTLKDIDIREKKVFMRIDINVPIDPETGEIIDDRRIRVHSKYLREIVEKYNPALVLGSHQGRPGEPDFTTLEKHRDLLAKYTGFNIKFIDDVIGPRAKDEIQRLKPGEVLLLDNLRLVSEEVIEAIPEKQSYTIMVKRLAPLFDYYVNDAFATAHRSQPSIVGFPLVLPSAIGPIFEKELDALRKAFTNLDQPRVFVLGGVKAHDMLRVIENLVRYKLADRILTTGVLAQLFLVAKGAKIGHRNMRLLEEKGSLPLIHRARTLLLKGAPIETPIDFKTSINGNVKNEYLGRIEGEIKDIGEETIRIYCEFMKEARVIIMRGPAGVVEEPPFREGTIRILDAAFKSNAFVLIAGGHLSSMVRDDLLRDNVHVSTAGNAILLYLSGEQLPAIKALEISARIFYQH
ncbi:MAG: phosphoglycerate kinase [Desulfurococcaceae archaeon]|uniref:Phosphoglycerate kinase n=1 Tax=Staphylothermus marinus TaxID=2280 RepID=A0A7C4NR22_STAMA